MTKEQKLISRAMSILGSRTSPAKRAAAAANAPLGGKARWKDHVKKPKRNTPGPTKRQPF